MDLHRIVSSISSGCEVNDQVVQICSKAYLAAKDYVTTWGRCCVMLVDASTLRAEEVLGVHDNHGFKTRRDRRVYRQAVEENLRRQGFDPVNTPSAVLAMEAHVYVVLYKTLCLDWISHRYSIRRSKAPRKIYRLYEDRIKAKGLSRPPTLAPQTWAAIVQLTGSLVNQACAECDEKSGKLMYCSKCMVFKYCSRECQRAHWKGGHHASCSKYRTGENSSFAGFAAFVDDQPGEKDPLATATYINGTTMGRLNNLTAVDVVPLDEKLLGLMLRTAM